MKKTRFRDEASQRNFLSELQTWLHLPEHPHLVACRFFRTVGDELAIFAEYVEGGSLDAWIAERRLTELHAGDVVLLCSDGLWEALSDEEINTILAWECSMRQRATQLVDRANEAGGPDNITVVLHEHVVDGRKSDYRQASKPVTTGATPAGSTILRVSEAAPEPVGASANRDSKGPFSSRGTVLLGS